MSVERCGILKGRLCVALIVSLLLTFHASTRAEPPLVLEVEPATQEVLRGDILLLRVILRNRTDQPVVVKSPLLCSLEWNVDTDEIGGSPNDLGPPPFSGSVVKDWTLAVKEERSTFVLASRQLDSEGDSSPAFDQAGKRECRLILRNYLREKTDLQSDFFPIIVLEEKTAAVEFPPSWRFASLEKEHLKRIERLKLSPERPRWERDVKRSSLAGLLTVACSPWQDPDNEEALKKVVEACDRLDPVTRDYALQVLSRYYYYPYTGRRPKLAAKMIERMEKPSDEALNLAEILRTQEGIEVDPLRPKSKANGD